MRPVLHQVQVRSLSLWLAEANPTELLVKVVATPPAAGTNRVVTPLSVLVPSVNFRFRKHADVTPEFRDGSRHKPRHNLSYACESCVCRWRYKTGVGSKNCGSHVGECLAGPQHHGLLSDRCALMQIGSSWRACTCCLQLDTDQPLTTWTCILGHTVRVY